MSFLAELKRRNVIKVAAAYIIIGWLIMQAGEVMGPALRLPEWINSALAFFLILGFPLAMFFAWAFEMTPDGIKKEKDIDRSQSITRVTGRKLDFAIIGLLVVALGYFVWESRFSNNTAIEASSTVIPAKAGTSPSEAEPQQAAEPATPKADEKSIAVLPFVNMSDDASNEYFSDGITEEVLNLLAKIPELKVTSRSSVFSFKGQNPDIPTVAAKLNVAHILEGSVRKSGNRVRITAQLIRADSDVHMWSETYDRELDDIFAIQDEIAREVVTVLQIQLLGEALTASTTQTEAYTEYLQGKHYMELASDIDVAAAQKSFEQAIEIDPNYAPAWAALSRALRWQANRDEIDLHEGTELAREAALKALALDDTLADAWASLARIQYVYDWDWSRARGTSQTALMHGPNNAYALEAAADIAAATGEFDQALKYALKAVDVDPLNPVMMRGLGAEYLRTGSTEKAEAIFKRVLELYPNYEQTYGWLGVTHIFANKPEEARQMAALETDKDFSTLVLAYAAYDLGDIETADRALDYHVDNTSGWLAYQIAELYAYRGEVDKAFEWLEITYDQRDGGVTHILSDTLLTPLYQDPRWEPYLLKVGLLDYWHAMNSREATP